jgi:hypothetical protein
LGCEGTKIWSDEILEKRFRYVGAEVGIRRVVGFKNKKQCVRVYDVTKRQKREDAKKE